MLNYDIKGRLVLVTGGSGFLGEPLIQRLLDRGALIRTMSRDEGKLIALKQKFPSIEIFTGDVSDPFEVRQAMQGVIGVFHLAASKHVGLAEKHVRECIKSNTIGSLNILEESLKQHLAFVIGISTDKAAQVAGVYGASKLLMERLFTQFDELNEYCDYRIVRYGNVLYSTGSVLCKWKALIEEGKEVIVTDLEATRFFWTVDHAIDLIFDCLDKSVDSKPYVPYMKGMSLGKLLEAMISKYSPDGIASSIKEIGLQSGENKHEKILEDGNASNEVEQYSVDEIKALI
jgi:UDP-N-acetylglucosamine 4,6-dehydratase